LENVRKKKTLWGIYTGHVLVKKKRK